MYSADYRKWEIVQLLLKRGANAQLVNIYNRNALHYAAYHNAAIEIIDALINAGADPTTKDCDGNTPGEYARSNGRLTAVDAAAYLEQFCAPTKSANFVI
jgi:ankyrin repeat protein